MKEYVSPLKKKKKTVYFIRFYIKFHADKNCNISGSKWFPVSPSNNIKSTG